MSRAVIPPRQGGHMVRAGCAATTCVPPPCSSVSTASRRRNHRSASHTYHSFTLRACQRQDRRVSSTPHCDFLICSAAIKNVRNSPANNIITFSKRQQFSFLRAHFALHESRRSNHFSPRTIFLIASGPVLEFDVTHSQETRKYFPTGGFSALFSFSRLVEPSVFHARPPLERHNLRFRRTPRRAIRNAHATVVP